MAAPHRATDHARRIAHHEANRLGCCEFARHDEVTLIFTALVISYHDQLALLDGLDGSNNRRATEPRTGHYARERLAHSQCVLVESRPRRDVDLNQHDPGVPPKSTGTPGSARRTLTL